MKYSSFYCQIWRLWALCVCSLTSPGQTQDARLGCTRHLAADWEPGAPEHLPGEAAMGLNFQLKGKKKKKKRQGSPLGKCRKSSVISLIYKLNMSVIASRPRHANGYYCSNKPQQRTPDKEDLEASKNPSQSHSPYWGIIRSETEGCKTRPVRKLSNLGNIKEVSIRKKGDNPRGYHRMHWGEHCLRQESGKSLSCTVWSLL